jgi:predicted nucleic acid-binding protein
MRLLSSFSPGQDSSIWAHTHEDSEAIIDDLAGRRCAAAFNIPVRGTLGLVLTAKQRGRISQRVHSSTTSTKPECICPTVC